MNQQGFPFTLSVSRMFRFLLLCVLSCISFCLHLTAQVSTPHPESEVRGESRDFRSVRSGRWVDLSTWQIYRSGIWVNASREVGVPNMSSNIFIEAGHTVIATRANTEAIQYNGAQGSAFLDVNNLHIHTNASITTTWGSIVGSFASTDWYNGDRFGGKVNYAETFLFSSYENGERASFGPYLSNFDIIQQRPCFIAPQDCPGTIPRARNMELRIYGKLRYYSGSAADRSDHDARVQVTAATIGTGSTLVFRGVSRVITQAHEWSTTLATQTGYFDNTAHTASMLASNPPERHANFRGLMGRNSFWTAIFDLGRFNDRNFSTDQFTGATDDPGTAVGTLQGTFTAGIVQVRRGTLRVEAPALLVNEGSVTSGVLHVMNNAVLQMVSGNVGRTGVYTEQFADGSANYLSTNGNTSTECRVTSRMRYAVVEEGGALEFPGIVGSLSAADVRFNGTVIYSRTGDQRLLQDSPYLSFNPAGPIIAPGLAAGENGLFDPYNNNFNANAGVQQAGDPTNGVLTQFGSSPSGLGVGTAALFQPSTTAAYSHLVLRGTGTKFLPVTTVTISRALILQGEARLGLQNLAYPGVPVSAGNATAAPVLPYYLSQAHGGELRANQSASKAGYFPPLVYLRSTGLTGFREENNIGTTLRTSLSNDGTELAPFNATPLYGTPLYATPQPLWSAYGGNTDPVAFVGFTTASTRLILYDQALYPEGASFPVGITLSASTNREQMDMTPSIKAPVVHGLPAEPSYLRIAAGHGYAARGVFYGDAPQALDGARFGQVIRQTLNRVNGTQSSATPMQKPLTGIQNFVNGFPVITNSLYDAPINSTATTTLQYDSEWDAMSQIEFPRGVWGAHNVVINCASNVTQTLPQRTADFQPASGNGVNWGLPHLNFTNRTSALTGATAGTLIAGPEHVMTANGHLPRHAFDPRTGLYQPNAVYNESAGGADSITPGTLASAYIDTRPDVNNENTKINDQYYTTGVGLRPSVSLTGTFDGRTRAGFPQGIVNAPSVFGASQTITTTAPNDFGRRGDFNNFGTLELRRGMLVAQNFANSYGFTLSSTAIISPDQANVIYRGERVGTSQARALVCLTEASGAEAYPKVSTWNGVGVRFGGNGVGGIVVRGPAGPANVAGVFVMGSRTSLIITGGTGGTIASSSNSPLLRFRAQSSINTGFDELPATLGIPGLEAFPPITNDQSTNDHVTINPAPDPNGFNNAWNLDLPYIRNGVGNLTMLRGTSNVLTLVGNWDNTTNYPVSIEAYGGITARSPELSGLQVYGTIATARGSLDLNGRNIELSGTTSTLVEAFERSPRPSSVINRHTKARAYIGLTSPRAVPLLDSAAAVQSLAFGGVPLSASLAGLGATIVNANFNADSTRFHVRRWQTNAANALTRLNAPNVPLANRYWTIETSGTQNVVQGVRRNFGLVLNYTDADVPQSLAPAPLVLLRGQLLPKQTPFQALAPSELADSTRKRTKQLALFAPEQVVYGRSIVGTGNFAVQTDSTQAGFQLWALGAPAPVSLVLRGQRFGGRFGDPIGAGFEGAGVDLIGFPPPFGSFATGGGISRTTADQFGAIIGPFKAGVPTSATIIGEVLDDVGAVAQFAPSTGAALVVGQVGGGAGPWNTGVPSLFSGTTGYPDGKIGAVSRGGRFEWANVRLDGVASTTVTLTLANDIVDSLTNRISPNPAPRLSYGDPQPVQVSLQGGFPFSVTFATQNMNNTGATKLYPGAQGPFAAPGRVEGYDGSIPTNATGVPTNGIVVGQTVYFPYATPGFSAITVIVKDRYGNYASFPTTATISITIGSPPVDQQRTPLVGQVATSTVIWGLGNLGLEVTGAPQLARPGIARVYGASGEVGTQAPQTPQQVNPQFLPTGVAALNSRASLVSPALTPTGSGYAPYNNPQVASHLASFPNFQIWGATASNVTLTVSSTNFDPNASIGLGAPGNTSATVHIVPGAAWGIMPVLIPDIYNRNQLDRMPSQMTIGVSNKNDPRTWFYVQAHDEFRNRVDNGPNAYSGGTATIRFSTSQEGLPRNSAGTFQFSASNDPYTRVNAQKYEAKGTIAIAVNGLYTFSDFTPLGPPSLEPLGKDVVLTIEDLALQGIRASLTETRSVIFPTFPPITTATTTFVQPPVLTLSASDSVLNGARKAAPNGLFLRERARTYRSTQNALETGFVRLTRPVTALADPTLNVQYSLDYFNATSGFDTTTFRISDRARLTPLPLAGTTTLPLPSAIILPDGLPSPALIPPMPQPVPTTINGLLGDVAPLAVGASGLSTAVLGTSGTIAFESGAVAQNVRFSARFSDQTYPRNPARQGVRLAVMRLRGDSTLPYRVESGADSAFVVLADPALADPLCINPLADKLYLMTGMGSASIQETLELEPPAWHTTTQSGGRPIPAWVFYDDNYDALQYAASSSDTTLVRVSVNAVDMRFSGRPTLTYAIQPFAPSETSATITVTASDGSAQARDTFAIAMRRPVGVEVESEQSASSLRSMSLSAMRLSVMPNPTRDETFAELLAPTAGVLCLRLLNVLGAVVWQTERSVQALEGLREPLPMEACAAGVYVLEARLGGMRSVVRIVKE